MRATISVGATVLSLSLRSEVQGEEDTGPLHDPTTHLSWRWPQGGPGLRSKACQEVISPLCSPEAHQAPAFPVSGSADCPRSCPSALLECCVRGGRPGRVARWKRFLLRHCRAASRAEGGRESGPGTSRSHRSGSGPEATPERGGPAVSRSRSAGRLVFRSSI